MTSPDRDLDAARERIRALDEEILRLAAERVRTAQQAGRAKHDAGRPTIDFHHERAVLERGRATASRNGLDAALAEDLLTRLIEASTELQETDRVAATGAGQGHTAVVVGGAGRMGRWIVRFLAASGYDVAIDDFAAAPESRRGKILLADADLVVAAIPPAATANLYRSWSASPPRGVILDVASVKSPLVAAFNALRDAGARIGSFHPLFGPGLAVLRGADVVLCTGGHRDADDLVRALFAPTTARLVEVPLDEHDRRMAEILSLGHATAIAYATALWPDAAGLHSTTSQRLQALARGVVDENPQVYFEIQAGNPHSAHALAALEEAVHRLRVIVEKRDATAFRRLLEEGRAHLRAREAPR